MILKNFRLFFIFSAVLSLTFFACKPKKADYVEQGPLDRGSSTVFPEPSIDEEPKVFGYLNQVRFGYSNNPTKDSVFIKYISDIELGTFPEKTAAKYAAGFIDTTRIENPPAPTVKIVTPRFAIQKGIFEYYPNPTTGRPNPNAFTDFFAPKKYSLSRYAEEGFEVLYYDQSGVVWSSSNLPASQVGSYLEIKEIKDASTDTSTVIKVKAKISCKLYNANKESILVTDTWFIGAFSDINE